MLSDHNGMKLEIVNRTSLNTQKLENTLLHNPWVKEEVSKE